VKKNFYFFYALPARVNNDPEVGQPDALYLL